MPIGAAIARIRTADADAPVANPVVVAPVAVVQAPAQEAVVVETIQTAKPANG